MVLHPAAPTLVPHFPPRERKKQRALQLNHRRRMCALCYILSL